MLSYTRQYHKCRVYGISAFTARISTCVAGHLETRSVIYPLSRSRADGPRKSSPVAFWALKKYRDFARHGGRRGPIPRKGPKGGGVWEARSAPVRPMFDQSDQHLAKPHAAPVAALCATVGRPIMTAFSKVAPSAGPSGLLLDQIALGDCARRALHLRSLDDSFLLSEHEGAESVGTSQRHCMRYNRGTRQPPKVASAACGRRRSFSPSAHGQRRKRTGFVRLKRIRRAYFATFISIL